MLKALPLWLPAYLRRRPRLTALRETHVVFCVCNHFAPLHEASQAEALGLVGRWAWEFPQLADATRDSTGEALRHTFFYPIEQYDGEIVGRLAEVCSATRCEAEMHLDRDTAERVAANLEKGKRDLGGHGLVASDAKGGVRFGIICGNGMGEELGVLKAAGCYADFTMPGAQDPGQMETINSIFYANPNGGSKSRKCGQAARAGVADADGLLMVQGPLGLNWRWRKWGVLPRVEDGELTPANPPTRRRLELWLELNVHVEARPDWVFVKLHTHGTAPRNMDMLLGGAMEDFHHTLRGYAGEHPGFQYHYATAREMVNMVHAAEAGRTGSPAEYRDFRYVSGLRC